MKKYYTLLCLLWLCHAFSAVIYVKPNGTGNGTSWNLAYGSLSTALQNAVSGDEIWVAQGVYTPHPTDINASFIFKNGVKLYGGFAGNETLLADRADTTGTTTFLSGSLSGTLHSKIILKAANASSTLNLIDGFTIEGAINESTNPTGDGGAGMQILSSVMELRNLIVRNNTMEVTISSTVISGLTGGAGIYAFQSNLSLYNVNVSDNSATSENTTAGFSMIQTLGAGIFAYNGSLTFNKGTVEFNQLTANNTSIGGAGIYLYNLAATSIKNIRFNKNHLETTLNEYVYGGALTLEGCDDAAITQCIFHDNYSSMTTGHTIYAIGDNPTFTNCTMGPGYMGDGIYLENTETTFKNCVFLTQVSANTSNDVYYYNCLSKYGYSNGNIIENSELAELEFINQYEGNYTPQPCSAYINFGNNAYITEATDINGNPRIVGSSVEPGATESQNTWEGNIIYVDANANNAIQDGSSWENALTSFSDALNCGCNVGGTMVRPQEIWVAQGMYNVPARISQTGFSLNNNQKIYGGFTPGAESLEERDVDFDTNQTILSGLMENNEYALHVVVSQDNDITTELNGFIIQDGRSFTPDFIIYSGGGGILVYDSHPTLKNLWIRNNAPIQYGGGILFYHAGGEMENIRISDNQSYSGGAISIYNSSFNFYEVNIKNLEAYNNTAEMFGGVLEISQYCIVNIDGFLISDNNSGNAGGAVYMMNAELNVNGGKFDGNHALTAGAIFADNMFSKVKAESVIFSNNTANLAGALHAYTCNIDLINCTFVNNTAVNNANLINSQNGAIRIKNSIIDNPSNGVPVVAVFPVSQATDPDMTIQNSIVTDDFTTLFTHLNDVQLNTDPQFVDAENGDYSLVACGPAVNAGVNSFMSLNPLFDAVGNNRISSYAVDLGAVEYQHENIHISPLQDISTEHNTPVVFQITELGAGTVYQWQVSTDGGATWTNIGANLPALDITATTSMNGNLYRCIVTQGCTAVGISESALLEVLGTVSVDDFTNSNASVYPNPATNAFTFRIQGHTADGNITIYDALGRNIYSEGFSVSEISGGKAINCAEWPTGIYWIKYLSNGMTQTLPLIKK